MRELLVFGLGRVFERHHWPAIQSDSNWRLVGACDPSAARRAWLADLQPGLHICSQPEEIVAHVDAHAVLIATPPAHHVALAILALGAGKHVLIEKPVGLDAIRAREVTEYAESRDRVLQVGFMRRFCPAYRALRARLMTLDSATIRRATIHMRFDAIGWSPVSGYLAAGQGGSVLSDVASHQADLVRWLFDAPPRRVRGTRLDSNAVTWEIEFDGDVIVRCVAEHGRPFRERVMVATATRVMIAEPYGFFSGPRRTVRLMSGVARARRFCHLAASRLSGRPNATRRSFAAQLTAFAARVNGGAAEGAGGIDAVRVHETLAAVVESCAKNSAWVRMDKGASND